jgi:DNA primase
MKVLYSLGVTNAVASMGTSVTPGQLKTASFGGRVKVVMLLDNDEAGIRALDRICQQLLNENTVSLPH